LIFTWDALHGEIEGFSARGEHRGAFDPVTGQRIKPRSKGDGYGSDVETKPRTFLDLYMEGQATADDANDFVSAWHNSGDEEQRPLTEFLAMTADEYNVWTMDDRALPDIAAARRPGGPALEALIAERVRRLRAANDPRDETALFCLGHWLKAWKRGARPATIGADGDAAGSGVPCSDRPHRGSTRR
jgi:hypothetical protein